MNITFKKVVLGFVVLLILATSIFIISYQQDKSRTEKTLAECTDFEQTFKRVILNFNEITELKSQLKSSGLTKDDAYVVRDLLIDYDARIKELLVRRYRGDIGRAASDELVYYQHGIEESISEAANTILVANYTVFQKYGTTSDSRYPDIYLYHQWLEYLADNEQGNLTRFKESFE